MNCLCLGISGRQSPLIQTEGMRLFGQGMGYGFWISGPRAGEAGVLVRELDWRFFSFLVIRLIGDEDERKSKAQKWLFHMQMKEVQGSLMGRKRYNENHYGGTHLDDRSQTYIL